MALKLQALLALLPPAAGFVALAGGQHRTTALLSTPAAAAARSASAPVCLLDEASDAAVAAADSSGMVTDTLLDLGVYALLAGVVALTLYSIAVTLQKSNEEYGGWTPRDDEDVNKAASQGGGYGMRGPGSVYDPATDTWSTKPLDDATVKAKVGRAPTPASSPGADGSEATNRYDRRMAKKRKQKRKKQ